MCRGNLEKTQALTLDRFRTLSSTQTLNILSKKQRTAFIEQVSYVPNFAAFTSTKHRTLIDNIIKRLKPIKTIKGKDIKQYHTSAKRKPLVRKLETFLTQSLTPFQFFTLSILRHFLIEGNVKPFIGISTINNYMSAFIHITSQTFDEAYYSDSLTECFNAALSSKKWDPKQKEYLSYCINKLNIIAPDLGLQACKLPKGISDKYIRVAKAQYVSYVEVVSVIQNLLNNVDTLSIQTVYAQVFSVILAYFAGLRRMEIVRIRHQDFTLTDSGFIARVKATAEGKPKYNSTRTVYVYLPDEIHSLLKTCLTTLSCLPGQTIQPKQPILAFAGQSLAERVSTIIQPVLLMLKIVIGDDIVLHSLRHAYAMNTLMQFRAVYQPASFILPSELTNSRRLFNEKILGNLTCESLFEACENTRINIGHKRFATTLQTYLAGTAFYALFAPCLQHTTLSRKRLVTLLQKGRSQYPNSHTESKIGTLIKGNIITKTEQRGTYRISKSNLHVLFQKPNLNINQQYCFPFDGDEINIVIPKPTTDLLSLFGYLTFILRNEQHPLNKFASENKRLLFTFTEAHSINVADLGRPALKKIDLYFRILNVTKPNILGIRIFTLKDIDRSQLRYVQRDLSKTGLWQALSSEAMNTRPPTYRHTIDDMYLHLLTEFIKESCHGY